ncbi:MAG: methyltransferase domain-containing protein [Succinimonas sp.]|nr:methyltransferase domain-containing protein [Succinimonas sp.]
MKVMKPDGTCPAASVIRSPEAASGDQSFDDRAQEFRERIYGSDKGTIRLEVLRQDFQEILTAFSEGQPLRVLDAGGGFAPFSRELALLGHQVMVTDISAEMLEIGRRDTGDLSFPGAGGISFVPGALQDLPRLFPSRQFDIVMCHAVLEWLEDPFSALPVLTGLVREGGFLSLMVYSRPALLFKSLIVGNYRYLENGMRPLRRKSKMRLTPPNPLDPREIREALKPLGFPETVMSGIRVFHDYMARYHLAEIPAAEILSWELKMRRNPDFAHLGRYAHIFGRKRNGGEGAPG